MPNPVLTSMYVNGQYFFSDGFVVAFALVLAFALLLMFCIAALERSMKELRYYRKFIENTQQLQRFHEWKKTKQL